MTAVLSQQYQAWDAELNAILESEEDFIANLANISAWLNMKLSQINWVGFYLLKGENLVLGPFQGNLACTRIPLGRGVCGTAAVTDSIMRIKDVHQFDGHIACDTASNAEIVLPIHRNGEVVAVLDIDSPVFERFSEEDEKGLAQLVSTIEKHVFI
ncbi:GAF domain-containing protein [Catenovulum sp. SM1970]|uniref:GAF domain-containing protein n=1 Tax=Marinifaba aquimaris TaxID=2741323 RepID=UPI001571B9D3|nr:GAF domain-containing protein [Marinifaba aquimaris]NTS76064.1 GAF domain-containing protein [Marinifaba aquimaris]